MQIKLKAIATSFDAMMLAANVAFATSGNYIVNTNSANLMLRSGPGSNYSIKARMPKGSNVYVNSVNGSWAYVTYNGIKGYASMQYLKAEPNYNSNNNSYSNTSSVKQRVGSIVTNTNGYWFTKSINPFSRGECTWYAFGRFGEVKNYRITFSQDIGRHAKYWYNLVNNCAKGTTIQPKCIAVRTTGGKGHGHVVFVEDVDSNYVYFSDANAAKATPGTLQYKTKSEFLSEYKYFIY